MRHSIGSDPSLTAYTTAKRVASHPGTVRRAAALDAIALAIDDRGYVLVHLAISVAIGGSMQYNPVRRHSTD